MGYRSDVAIAIYGPEDAMVAMIAGQRLAGESVLDIEKEYIEQTRYTSGGEPYLMLSTYQEGVKWYDSYPEVQAWSDFLDTIADNYEETGIACEFVRIGEDPSDIEEKFVGDVEFHVTVHRSVSIDLPPEPVGAASTEMTNANK